MSKARMYRSRLLSLILAAAVLLAVSLGVLNMTAYAEGVSYYATWDEYKDAHGITAPTWNDVAERPSLD